MEIVAGIRVKESNIHITLETLELDQVLDSAIGSIVGYVVTDVYNGRV